MLRPRLRNRLLHLRTRFGLKAFNPHPSVHHVSVRFRVSARIRHFAIPNFGFPISGICSAFWPECTPVESDAAVGSSGLGVMGSVFEPVRATFRSRPFGQLVAFPSPIFRFAHPSFGLPFPIIALCIPSSFLCVCDIPYAYHSRSACSIFAFHIPLSPCAPHSRSLHPVFALCIPPLPHTFRLRFAHSLHALHIPCSVLRIFGSDLYLTFRTPPFHFRFTFTYLSLGVGIWPSGARALRGGYCYIHASLLHSRSSLL